MAGAAKCGFSRIYIDEPTEHFSGLGVQPWQMTRFFKLVALLALLPIGLVAALLVHETTAGRIGWFVLSPANVIVDGVSHSGYLHRAHNRPFFLLTRTDDTTLHTYLIAPRPLRFLIDCGDRSAGRWWFVPMGGDINPPCSGFSEERDPALFATFKQGPGFLEFWTRSGKKVRAEWQE